MAAARTDLHSPTKMDPEAYEYCYADDNQRPGRLIGVDMDWWRSITNWAAATADRGINQCHHCGAHIRYFAILRHVATGENIAIGETCLDNRFSLESKADFDRLRKASALDRQAQRCKTAAREILETLDGDVHIALTRETDLEATLGLDGYALSTITDIRRRLWQYGEVSDRQLAFVGKLLAEHADRQARNARIAAERVAEVRISAPAGRVAFEGIVVARKYHESQYGVSHKLTVKCNTPEGVFLVWVTEPSKITTERGDLVGMVATLTRSDRDEAFAFGSRPAKAVIVARHADPDASEVTSLD